MNTVSARNKRATHLFRVCYLLASLGKGLYQSFLKGCILNTAPHIVFSLPVFWLLLLLLHTFFNLQKWFHKIPKSGAVIAVPRVRAFPSTGEGSIFIYFLFPGALWPPQSKQKGNVLFSSEPQMLLIYFSPEPTVIYHFSLFSLLPPLPSTTNCTQVATWQGSLGLPEPLLLPVNVSGWMVTRRGYNLRVKQKNNLVIPGISVKHSQHVLFKKPVNNDSRTFVLERDTHD